MRDERKQVSEGKGLKSHIPAALIAGFVCFSVLRRRTSTQSDDFTKLNEQWDSETLKLMFFLIHFEKKKKKKDEEGVITSLDCCSESFDLW